MSFREVTIGSCRLINADCMDVLPTLTGVDAVVTDPPYGIDVGSMSMGKGKKSNSFEAFGWDANKPCDDLICSLGNHPAIIWGGNYFALPPSGCWLSWDKAQEFSGADFELAWTNLTSPSKAFRMSRVEAYGAVARLHPTQKPLALIAWCLSFLPDAQTILDPFMGSGTTGVACIQTERQFIGIEKEPKYFDIACQRIQRAWDLKCSELPFEKPVPLKQRELIGIEE